jgi:polypeptide N-acetylgalactosaminyltransferase
LAKNHSKHFLLIAKISRNYKRVAEVWMDEYAKNVYERDPEEWYSLDVGDVSQMRKIKQKLQCKPFQYFLEVVAPEMMEKFPPFETDVFASGAVRFKFN